MYLESCAPASIFLSLGTFHPKQSLLFSQFRAFFIWKILYSQLLLHSCFVRKLCSVPFLPKYSKSVQLCLWVLWFHTIGQPGLHWLNVPLNICKISQRNWAKNTFSNTFHQQVIKYISLVLLDQANGTMSIIWSITPCRLK